MYGGDERLSKFRICSCLKRDNRGDFPSWNRILEDFDSLAEGVVDGEPVARSGRRQWKFILLVCKADEEVKTLEFGMPSYSSHEVCSDCLGNDGVDLPFTDLSRGAQWRATEGMGVEAWKARFRTPLHPLVASHYCCCRWFFFLELMHLADCKGFSALANGGVLGLLLQRRSLGRTKADRLEAVN